VKKKEGVARKRPVKYLLKFLRIVGWTTAGLLILLVLLIGLIRLPAVQNRLVDKATAYLQDRIGTEVTLGRIVIAFPKSLVLEDLYLEDQQGDTLVYAHHFEVNTSLVAILKRKIAIKDVRLETARVFVKRNKNDSSFNFSYIVEAFTGPEEDSIRVEEDDAKAWAISLDDVALKNTLLSWRDQYMGNEFIAYLGLLDVNAKEINPIDNIYRLKRIELKNANLSASLFPTANSVAKSPTQDTATPQDTTSLPFVFDLSRLIVENSIFRYDTPFQGATVDVGKIDVESRELDLRQQVARLKDLAIENTRYSLTMRDDPESSKESPRSDTTSLTISPWTVSIDRIDISDNTFQLYNLSDTVRDEGVDPSRIWISRLDADIRDIAADKVSAKADIRKITFRERSGLMVRRVEGKIDVTDRTAYMEGLRIVLNRSYLAMDARSQFKSLQDLGKDFGRASFAVSVNPSHIYADDILLFSPQAFDSTGLHPAAGDKVAFSGKLVGNVSDLQLRNFIVDGLDSSRLHVSGRLQGLPEIKNVRFNLALHELRTTRSDLSRIAASSLPSGIVVPDWMNLQGKAEGTYLEPTVDLALSSSFGNINLSGKANLNGKGSYDARIEAADFKIGELIANEDLGAVDLKAHAAGTGTTPDSLDAKLDLLLSKLNYKGYNYQELRLNGKVNRHLFKGAVVMEDENLDFSLKADLDYGKEIPSYLFTLNMRNIDMKALQLTERPLRARATLDVDLQTADFKVLNGRVDIRKVAVFNGAKLYAIDSLLVASVDQVGESSIEIRSDIMTGDFKGTINIFGLPTALRQHFNSYFSLNDTTLKAVSTLQAFDFDLTLKNTDLLTEVLLPPLEPFTPGKIHGSFNSEERNLDLVVKLADFVYGGLSIDSISMSMKSDAKALSYDLAVKKIRVDTLHIHDLAFHGTAAKDSIQTSLKILDSLRKERYLIGARLTRAKEGLQFGLIPKQVVLNESKWDVPEKNRIRFSNGGMQAEDFSISKGNQKVALTTTKKDSLINLEFKELELGNITRIISGAVPASGELNGKLTFSSSNSGEFSSRLLITDLTLLHKPWGDLNLNLHHAGEQYNFTMNVRGNRTKMEITGDYKTVDEASVFSLKADIPTFNLELAEPFTLEQARKMEGILTGDMALSGALPDLDIRGKLNFRDATFEATYLNSQFNLIDETISFREEGIVFDKFEILDAQKNKMQLRGRIQTESYRNFDLELDLKAEGFQVLNKPPSARAPVYGLAKIDVDADVRGPSTHPRVNVKIGLSDDSNVTYVIPQSEAGVIEQQGIVTFVDKDAKHDPFLREVKPKDELNQGFKGMELSAVIDLRDRETLNIVIDPETGDQLTVKGNANLTFNIDPSGNMNLSGRYEITDGKYNLSFYKLVKREFQIVKGSLITWSGDPLRGALDIRALYKVEAAPVELVINQLSSSDESVVGPYRNRLPFEVYLNIAGELMMPEISFRLDMPEDKRNVHGGMVYARIQDIDSKEADLNKQVFGLLILQNFVAENPLEGSSGGDLQNSARISASRLLSEQLNRLSSKIKGVELSVNVKSFEDYTKGEAEGRTQAQLGLSKTLFGDRLVVKLTGNVDIEGESQQSNVTDYIGDIALEYKMTTDGRFRLTGFRNSNYDMIDGELIETGAGVIYIKDYNALRELFKANENNRD
jgi:translocation and assembly module TamB